MDVHLLEEKSFSYLQYILNYYTQKNQQKNQQKIKKNKKHKKQKNLSFRCTNLMYWGATIFN